MRNIKKIRFQQIREFGRQDAKRICKEAGIHWLVIYWDILFCYFKYGVWSNQYSEKLFWKLPDEDRRLLGQELGRQNRISDAEKQRLIERYDIWWKGYDDNRRFIDKYSNYHWETSQRLREKRLKAYTERYHMGKNCTVQYGVELCTEHFLYGSIKIGDNVLLAKHVFIDYSGDVEIGDNVQLMNGVVIESHFHPWHSDYHDKYDAQPTRLIIEDGVAVGSRAIILASCHHIGKNSRVGAGAVVTKNVPDNVIVAGVPATIIKYLD